MKYKAIIFDLDGTLLDTLKGITDAVNLSFKELGFDFQHDYQSAKSFIGAGAMEFVSRAMVALNPSEEQKAAIGERFLINYDKIQNIETIPFPGVGELLKKLKQKGFYVCVASNKPQLLLEHVLDDKFKDFKFDVRFGQRKDVPIKPDPYVINEICSILKINKSDCLYVGDSVYDYETAINANIDCCIVKYGYGFYDQDFVKKSTFAVDSVKDLENLLLN